MKSTVLENVTWMQNGITVVGGNGKGNGLNQLSSPIGIYVDDDQTVYVADARNNRILEWRDGATKRSSSCRWKGIRHSYEPAQLASRCDY